MTNSITESLCNGCNKSISKFKKRYKGKKYCDTCYARIFKKRICPCCGMFARLPKNDDQAICNDCIKKQPCIRCNLTDKPIGKITEYGLVCNSCSVHFRDLKRCERCNTPSKKLTKISRFDDDLRVCPKCATRDYGTCPSCYKHRLLELDENGIKICKKCKNNEKKPCLVCNTMIAAGCSDICNTCYWYENLWKKHNQNRNLFEDLFLKKQYEDYTLWLSTQVGVHKAALYLNKHTHFFIKTEMFWKDSLPSASQLLMKLRARGLRKFELIMQWLDEVHGIQVTSISKRNCSENDQIMTLIESLSPSSLAYRVITVYKQKLDAKMHQGFTSVRSIRLAIKPAVALMLCSGESDQTLPNLENIKAYLTLYPGQAAALTGFINFLNDEYDTNINYNSIKKSRLIKDVIKQKLENELMKMICGEQDFDKLTWVKKGLQYFHDISYQRALGVKANMIVEVQDGYNISYKNHNYWLPKEIRFERN